MSFLSESLLALNVEVRKHFHGGRSAKVFRLPKEYDQRRPGGTCDFCEHCNAYDVLNTLLGCRARHGCRAAVTVQSATQSV